MNIVVQQLSDGEKKFDRDSQQLKQWRQKQELDTSKIQEISGKIINLRTELEHGEGNLRLLEEQKATIIQKIRSSLSEKRYFAGEEGSYSRDNRFKPNKSGWLRIE